ncbi:hypothetical protein N7527_000217 [Penicillium freii]|nr:hypothetical protein N7527_000217 [Penicillium freii]
MSPARTHCEVAFRQPPVLNQPPRALLSSSRTHVRASSPIRRGPEAISTYSETQGSIGFTISRSVSSSISWINS